MKKKGDMTQYLLDVGWYGLMSKRYYKWNNNINNSLVPNYNNNKTNIIYNLYKVLLLLFINKKVWLIIFKYLQIILTFKLLYYYLFITIIYIQILTINYYKSFTFLQFQNFISIFIFETYNFKRCISREGKIN